MSDFVTKPGAPPAESEPPIDGGPFFPAIDPAQARRVNRVTDDVTAPRWRQALIVATIEIQRELADYAAARLADGYATLAAVPAAIIDGASELITLYHRAVAARAKADVIERTRDLDTSKTGDARADMLDPAVAELRRDAVHAVRLILGQTPTCVDLI